MQRNVPSSRPARLLPWLLAATLAAAAGSTWARNDKLLLPIAPALSNNATRQVLRSDVQLRFGGASAQGVDVSMGGVEAHAVADPYANSGNPAFGGRRERLSDERVCLDAFRKALVELQAGARRSSASAVVGIVSYYNKVEMDSREVYECHIGHTRGVVDLKGKLSRSAAPQAASARPAAEPPLAAVQPAMQPAPAPAVTAPAMQPPRLASGFAAIDDVDAIPYINDLGRTSYRDWVGRSTPKAFAISDQGHWAAAWGMAPADPAAARDPNERAIAICQQRSKGLPCRLYAVNGSVVWVKEAR
jgi:hypothetical protein